MKWLWIYEIEKICVGVRNSVNCLVENFACLPMPVVWVVMPPPSRLKRTQYVPSKRWYVPTDGVTIENNNNDIFTVVRTSYFTHI
jgi:hypothetical protein